MEPNTNANKAIAPKVLHETLRDLQHTSPYPGLVKALLSLVVMGLLIWVSLSRVQTAPFIFWSIVTGIVYSSIFLLTHDAMHRTLTGWKWFDGLFARVIAYPMLWYHGIYAALHDIHHKMNGNDTDDPERPQWTEEEYQKASRLGKWCMRNQLWLNCFVWGGFGFLFKHYWQAFKFYKRSRAVRLAVWTDVLGVLLVQAFINVWAISAGNWFRVFCFFIILERIMGAFHQYRSWIEHYGLWGKEATPFETQIRNSRNIKTNPLTSFYIDHLNYHSIHHAFPKVPFYNLKKAHERLVKLYKDFGRPIAQDTSYLKTGWQLATNPVVIASPDRGLHTDASQVIPIRAIDS